MIVGYLPGLSKHIPIYHLPAVRRYSVSIYPLPVFFFLFFFLCVCVCHFILLNQEINLCGYLLKYLEFSGTTIVSGPAMHGRKLLSGQKVLKSHTTPHTLRHMLLHCHIKPYTHTL